MFFWFFFTYSTLTESCFFLCNFVPVLEEVQMSRSAQAKLICSSEPWASLAGSRSLSNVVGKVVSWEDGCSSFILPSKISVKVFVKGVKTTRLCSEFFLLTSAEWLYRHLVTSGCFVKLRYSTLWRESKNQTSAFKLKVVNICCFVFWDFFFWLNKQIASPSKVKLRIPNRSTNQKYKW